MYANIKAAYSAFPRASNAQNYAELKRTATDYNQALQLFKEALTLGNFGVWVKNSA